ncbi:PDZ domain-containing protein [Bacillus sp. WMMC1349]|uniref:PDZ domain-containing protein n=1 Tax=Bacillus sp. WMMC1349 TaxID=2736254 RepID=UPI0015567F8A|nr:PDZ domain-containing protein [Bacillus sp. WMMC1349]NPC94293.1 PDZ domain-containing protein [Bacillus sp. WMMC1349]
MSVEDSLIELLKGVGIFFLHPLFYLMIAMSLLYGYARVKRERKTFHTRIEDVYNELKFTYSKGILPGILLSLVSLGIGLVVPVGMLLLIAILTAIAALTCRQSTLSSAYTLGVSMVLGFCLMTFGSKTAFALPQMSYVSWSALAILLGLVLTAEGILIYKTAHIKTSPAIVTSKRGQPIGQQVARRVWLLPLFILIPGHAIEASVSWWPVLPIHSDTFQLLWIPYIFGFHQRVQGSLPIESIKVTGRRISILGIFTLLVAAAGIWWSPLTMVVPGMAIIGRFFISWKQRVNDNSAPFYFSKRDQGLMVLGIIPNTPAADLGLQIGEIITKVNGCEVKNTTDFYEALQKNRAFFKLEIIGLNQQVRFEQRASYEGEHHELGILFVEEQVEYNDSEVAASTEKP